MFCVRCMCECKHVCWHAFVGEFVRVFVRVRSSFHSPLIISISLDDSAATLLQADGPRSARGAFSRDSSHGCEAK